MRHSLPALAWMLLLPACIGVTAGPALAQDLGDGVFILHQPPGIWHSDDITDYCGHCTLTNCEDQNPTFPDDDQSDWVWYIVSNFWQTQSFNAIEYGITYGGAQFAAQASGICAANWHIALKPVQCEGTISLGLHLLISATVR